MREDELNSASARYFINLRIVTEVIDELIEVALDLQCLLVQMNKSETEKGQFK